MTRQCIVDVAVEIYGKYFIKRLTTIQPVGTFVPKIRYGRLLAGTGVSK